MCLGSKGSNTTTTTSTPPPEVMAAYRNVVGRAQNVANLPYTGAPVDIAGFTPDQMNAFQSINQAQGMGMPFFNRASDYAGIGGANISDQTPLLSDNTNSQLASSAANQFTSWTPNYLQSALAALPMLMGMTGAGLSPQGGMPAGTYAPPGYSMGLPPGTWTGSSGALPPGTWMGNSGNLPPGTFTGSTGNLPPGISGGSLSDITGGMVPGVNASTINQFMSPYTQQVIDATQRQFNNQNEQQRQGLVGNAISAGAWGGDRAGVAQAELANQQHLAQDPVIANLYQSGYGQALSEANQQQQTGLAKAGLSLQQLQALGQLGLGQQQADISRMSASGQLGLGQQQADISRMGTSGQLGLGQQQADISRMGTSGQLGLGQENYGLGLMGTSGQLSLGQQGVGINQAQQALQALQLGMSGSQNQDQMAMARAQAAQGMFGQNAQLAMQAAAQSGQLGLGAGDLYSNLGMNIPQSWLSQASAQLQSGGLQQQLQQEWNNVQNANYMAAQQWPFTTTSFLAGITGNLGQGMGGTSSQTAPAPSLLSQLGGLGMTGLALAKLVKRGGRVGLDAGGPVFSPGGVITPENVLRSTTDHPAAPTDAPHFTPAIPVTSGTPGSVAAPNFVGQQGGLGPLSADAMQRGMAAIAPPTDWSTVPAATVANGPVLNFNWPSSALGGAFVPDNLAALPTEKASNWSPGEPYYGPPTLDMVTQATQDAINQITGGADPTPEQAQQAQDIAYNKIEDPIKHNFLLHGILSRGGRLYADGGEVFGAPGLDSSDDFLQRIRDSIVANQQDIDDKTALDSANPDAFGGLSLPSTPDVPPAYTPTGPADPAQPGVVNVKPTPGIPSLPANDDTLPMQANAGLGAAGQMPDFDQLTAGASQVGDAASGAGAEAAKGNWLDKAASSPWMALLAAGLGTMSGTSPYPLVNIGTGGKMALSEIKDLRAEKEKRESAAARLSILRSNADLNAKRLKALTDKALEDQKHWDIEHDPAKMKERKQAEKEGELAAEAGAAPKKLTAYEEKQLEIARDREAREQADRPLENVIGPDGKPIKALRDIARGMQPDETKSGERSVFDEKYKIGLQLYAGDPDADDKAARFASSKIPPTEVEKDIEARKIVNSENVRGLYDSKEDVDARIKEIKDGWKQLEQTERKTRQSSSSQKGLPGNNLVRKPGTPAAAQAPVETKAKPLRPATVPAGARWSPSQGKWWWQENGQWRTGT
jgi:hypothetical protein